MASNLFAKKSITKLIQESEGGGGDGHGHTLKRTLSATNLILLGIGAVIGTGIFVLTGSAAAQFAGPGLVISFIIAGVACAFAGLCYAEFAAMIPIAGSAYTYGYATLGELIAWIIGWDLILEYMFGAATVAVGWSGYVVSFLRDLNIHIPPQWWNAPGIELVQDPKTNAWMQITDQLTQQYTSQGVDMAALPHATGVFNLLAAGAILLITVILIVGIQESARFNNFIVFIKLFVVLAFILAGGYYLLRNPAVAAQNWTPFVPDNTGEFGHYGWSGILRAAGVIFFAYIGFDAVSTAAQEAKNPQRDMPVGLLGSLAICTVLYILVSAILTGIVDYRQLNVAEPIAVGIEATGYTVLTDLVKIGAIAGLSSVMLVMLLGQPRIFYSMSRDGLIPPLFGKVHPKFQTPYISSILIGIVAAITAGALPIAQLGEMTSIGTLLAFIIVCGGVWYMRVQDPERARPFRTPWVPLVPILGMVVCFAMMASLNVHTWYRLLGWLAIGLIIYFTYSRKHSKLNQEPVAHSGQ